MTIAEVISWKFNDQSGMRCIEIDGILQIVEFPGGIPSKADQDKWTKEYTAYINSPDREREQMVVTPYQARQALLDKGLLDQVESMMADPTTPVEVRLMWEHKKQIRRLHPATIQMLDQLGLTTEEQKDDLFRYGMSLEP